MSTPLRMAMATMPLRLLKKICSRCLRSHGRQNEIERLHARATQMPQARGQAPLQAADNVARLAVSPSVRSLTTLKRLP